MITRPKRIVAPREQLLAYGLACPACGQMLGPRFVTREHLDVPPDPPYAATVRCPKCGEAFEVVFTKD